MAGKRIHMVLSIDMPEGVNATETMAYVRDAVRSWSGQFEPPNGYIEEDIESPGDPRFGMGRDVTVRRYP